MIPYERQQLILQYLSKSTILKIGELLKYMPEVSESTLRRDIKELEDAHQVERLTGGAIKLYSPTNEVPSATKKTIHTAEKKLIAQTAANQIQPGETIYIDSGSTCTELLLLAMNMPLIIVTTNTDFIPLITPNTSATIMLAGGVLNTSISSLYGPITNTIISQFNFDKAFLGANGIDIEKGITTPHIEESEKKYRVATQSKKTFILADSSKFNRVSTVHSLDLANVTIISDATDPDIEQYCTILTA